jgi:hypothetical protein
MFSKEGLVDSSMVEHLPSMLELLGLSPNITKNQKSSKGIHGL